MKPIDYSNAIMYKIVPKNLNLNLIYIGHTTNFTKRKCHHKIYCNTTTSIKSNYKVYQMIRDNGGWAEWEMLEIEKYPCNNSNEARTRERELMEQYNANLNSRKSISSKKEYTETHKVEKQAYDKFRRNGEKRESILEKKRQHYQANKDAIQLRAKEKRLEKKLLV
jgi:hypothetical protein